MKGVTIGELDRQRGIADDNFSHPFNQQGASLVVRTLAKDRGKPPGFGITVDVGHDGREVLGQKVDTVALQLVGGEPVRSRPAILDGLGVRHIVAEPLSVTGGVGRTHLPTMAIDDQPLQQAGGYQPRLAHGFGA